MEVDINIEFKVKLTSIDQSPAYSQSLPKPINLKKANAVELAPFQKYGHFTTFSFSKEVSLLFAQKKPYRKLRLLVDFRKINNLISAKYINNNRLLGTLTDAGQHIAGRNVFFQRDCSQTYHCLQMADQRSAEMLAFNSASWTHAYPRQARDLSRSLSAFSSFLREGLDPVIKADYCAQYVNDTGIAANSIEQLITNLRTEFNCVQNAGLKLYICQKSLWNKTS